MSKFATIGVAGAGAWGLALANAAAAAGRSVVVWGRDARRARRFGAQPDQPASARSGARSRRDGRRRHRRRSPPRTPFCWSFPPKAAREAATRLAERLAPRPLIVCAKGIERGSQRFMTEVVAEAAPGWPAAILSGPSFAADVAAGLPTAVTLASADEALARALSAALSRAEPAGSIIRPTRAASRSAARPRTCWRSPAAWRPGSASAPAPARR